MTRSRNCDLVTNMDHPPLPAPLYGHQYLAQINVTFVKVKIKFMKKCNTYHCSDDNGRLLLEVVGISDEGKLYTDWDYY